MKSRILVLVILALCLISQTIDAANSNHNAIGYNLLQAEKYEEAIIYFRKAIAENQNNVTAYNNLGATYYRLKQYDNAIAQFEQVILLDPKYVKAYINIASCYFWKGEYQKAYHFYIKGKKIDPNYVDKRVSSDSVKVKVNAKLEETPKDSLLLDIQSTVLH